MDKKKLDYFRNLLLKQRQQALEAFEDDRAAATQQSDGVIDVVEASQLERDKTTALDIAGRESELLEEIDAALQRIEDGTYGQGERCGKAIDEERLKAMPTARYDAKCQAAIEAAKGVETPTL